jgi:hypothetical protein
MDLLDNIVRRSNYQTRSNAVEWMEVRHAMTVLVNKMIRSIYSMYASLSQKSREHVGEQQKTLLW